MNERPSTLLLISISGFFTLALAGLFITLIVLFPPAATAIPLFSTIVMPGTGSTLLGTAIIPAISILFATLGLTGFVTSAVFYFKRSKQSNRELLPPVAIEPIFKESLEHQKNRDEKKDTDQTGQQSDQASESADQSDQQSDQAGESADQSDQEDEGANQTNQSSQESTLQRSESTDWGRETQEIWGENQRFLDANPDQDYAKIIANHV